MADFSTIIQEINAEITTNGVGAITGAKLNEVLRDMIAAVNAEKQDPLTIDATPTEDSTNPVQSGGVYDFLQSKATLYYVEDITDIPPTILNRLQVGDVVRFGNDFMAGAIVTVIENGQMWLVVLTDRVEVFVYDNGSYFGNATYNLSDFSTKVAGATNGNFAGLDADGNLTDSGSKASDFATAAQGGKADTAYQMPTGGIPASDLASAVQTSLGKADTALQSYTESDPVFSASPAAGITSGDIADWDGKADPIPVVDASTIPASMEPNKLYKYGTLSGDTVFPSLATPTVQSRANVYWWKFTTPASTINVQMPSAITIWNGGQAPTIDPSTTYEITVEDGFGTCIKS